MFAAVVCNKVEDAQSYGSRFSMNILPNPANVAMYAIVQGITCRVKSRKKRSTRLFKERFYNLTGSNGVFAVGACFYALVSASPVGFILL